MSAPLLLCSFAGGILAIANVALRSSDAYRLAVTRAEHDPSVIAELGSPMHPGWLTAGEIKVSGTEGEANLAIPISGLRGSGKINARASKSAGAWSFSQLHVDITGRASPVDLLAP